MCYTCGCNRPYDDMGQKANITESSFEVAGQTRAAGKKGKLTAKKNMIVLLQKEIEKDQLEIPQEQYTH